MFIDTLYAHSLYDRLNNIHAVRTFMAGHVVSVYNFMILLKGLQKHYLPVKDPCNWYPTENKYAIRAIATLIADEETDVITYRDGTSECMSHFELYIEAMKEAGASPTIVNKILSHYSVPYSVPGPNAKFSANFYKNVKAYHDTILDVVESGDQLRMLAFFHAGRETIIPGMFSKILEVLEKNNISKIEYFKAYLERHIHIDGEVHSTILDAAIDHEIGSDSDMRVLFNKYAQEAILHRIDLYNAIDEEILDLEKKANITKQDIALFANSDYIKLSDKDIELIQAMINNPPEPTPELKEAFAKYRNTIG